MGSTNTKSESKLLTLRKNQSEVPKATVKQSSIPNSQKKESAVSSVLIIGKKESAVSPLLVKNLAVIKSGTKSNISDNILWEEYKQGIPYVIVHEGFNMKSIQEIRKAIDEFHKLTPVKFKEITEADIKMYESYISFHFSDEITFSSIGRSKGDNQIYLECWVEYNGIIHELMHNLGFMHEHQRQDRDLFVKPKVENDPDFVKIKDLFEIGPYDPESIMHYDLCKDLHISVNSLLNEEQKNKLIKLAKTFSKGDLEALNFFYGRGNMKCSFEEYGTDFLSQPYYHCIDCWGENSVLGCCISCRYKCHKDHKVKYVPPSKELFFCDCGKNKHRLKCTFISTGNEEFKQPIYKCITCKKNDFCFPCSKKCHKGHQTETLEKSISFCKCTCLK